MKKYFRFLPHRWINARLLSRFFWGLFYADLAFTCYAAYLCAAAWLTPAAQLAQNSAPLRQLYTLAAGQALFLALLLAAVARTLQTLTVCERAVK